jgi:hypothetical protein
LKKAVGIDADLIGTVASWENPAKVKARLRLVGLLMQYAAPVVVDKARQAEVVGVVDEMLQVTAGAPYQEVASVWLKDTLYLATDSAEDCP